MIGNFLVWFEMYGVEREVFVIEHVFKLSQSSWNKKTQPTNKPDSVILSKERISIIYLAPTSRLESICLPPDSGELPFRDSHPHAGVHDISTHKVYPPLWLLKDAVRSYRTFSPLPFYWHLCQTKGGYFLRHSLYSLNKWENPIR